MPTVKFLTDAAGRLKGTVEVVNELPLVSAWLSAGVVEIVADEATSDRALDEPPQRVKRA